MNIRRMKTCVSLLAIVFTPFILFLYFNGCAEEQSDLAAPSTGHTAGDVDATERLPITAIGAVLIDFENPPGAAPVGKGGSFVDRTTGVTFAAVPEVKADGERRGVVGLIGGSSTGLCHEINDPNEKSGTGARGHETLDDGGFAMRVEFPEPLRPPATISVEFYTKVQTVIHVRLLSPSETEVSSLRRRVVAPTEDVRGFSDAFTSRTVVSVTSDEPVAFAVLAVTEQLSGSGQFDDDAVMVPDRMSAASAFVIDNLRFGSFVGTSLDIRPGSCPNPLNPKSHGVLPAAILGSPELDVATIDISSLRLEGVAPIPTSVKRTSVPGIRGGACECKHGGPDGFEDLTMKFKTQDVAGAIGSVQPHEVRVLTLAGVLLDGTQFEASDCVRIVGTQETVSEVVSTPETPEGPSVAYPGISGTYCTGGATSSEGHPIEYQFDFDAEGKHDLTAWTNGSCAEHAWPAPGTHVVSSRARCAVHPDVVSSWSDGVTVAVSLVTEPPEIRFATSITQVLWGVRTTVTKPYNPSVLDTVGAFRPFEISYHGTTKNGVIRAYQFFSLTPGVDLDGAGVWTADTSDTVRTFPNVGEDVIPGGTFRLAAQCRDDADAESVVDAATFQQGVCQIQVNFDPDTDVYQIENTYSIAGQKHTDWVNFLDGIPDTVPYNSWVRIDYRGWDSSRDSTLCWDDVNKCMRYQVQFERNSDRIPGAHAQTPWLPFDPKDSNPNGTSDSTSMNIGSVEYEIRARSVDENGKPDGTPPRVPIVGNFNPTLDSYAVQNHTGESTANGDTLAWDWWHPAREGFNIDDPSNILRTKEFYFVVRGGGHDHPKDPDGSGIKSWLYEFHRADDPSITGDFARSGSWVDGITVNELSDTFRVVFSYPFDDIDGNAVFENLPGWLNKEYDFSLRGRDTETTEMFHQFMFLDHQRELIDSYNTGMLGRWTEEARLRFHFAIRR